MAFIGSTLFAVMPITWLLRMVYLDTILLPFLLASLLFANSIKNGLPTDKNSCLKNNFSVMLSGIFLGMGNFHQNSRVYVDSLGWLSYIFTE